MTDKVPEIGGARGVFEIFIPGLFLLLNLWGALYLLPFTDEITRRYLQELISRPSLGAVVIIPFGYLTGVILRLFRADLPDRHSGLFQRLFRCRNQKDDQALWIYETFPYPGWLAYLVEHRFPKEAQSFFSRLCSTSHESHKEDNPRKRKQFINFCKVVVSSSDPLAAAEIYSAESLSRYISGMYYALCFSQLLLISVVVSRLSKCLPVGLGLISLFAAYMIGILAILANFRFIRIKEVEIIFAAIYKNRELFLKDTDQSSC